MIYIYISSHPLRNFWETTVYWSSPFIIQRADKLLTLEQGGGYTIEELIPWHGGSSDGVPLAHRHGISRIDPGGRGSHLLAVRTPPHRLLPPPAPLLHVRGPGAVGLQAVPLLPPRLPRA